MKYNFKKYKIHKQLGNKGIDGITYLVTPSVTQEDTKMSSKKYAMKVFKTNKTTDSINREIDIQKIAATHKIGPQIYDSNVRNKHRYIVMDKMTIHLYDVMKKQNGLLTLQQQKDIIRLYKSLDKALIFHGDSNILNYMYKKNTLYMIDYGLSKHITTKLIKSLGTDKPNMKYMLLGFVLKLKELQCPKESYTYLTRYISEEDRKNFKL